MCDYVFKYGENKGQICNALIERDGKCRSHMILNRPEEGTCSHKFMSGPRVGTYCPEFSEFEGYCSQHMPLDEPNEVVPTCHHRFTKGPRNGKYCSELTDPGQEYCFWHNSGHLKLEDPIEINGQMTCSYRFTKGPRMGFYCPYFAQEGLFCMKHQLRELSKKDTLPSCNWILMNGHQCQKKAVAESEFCSSHKNKKIKVKKPKATKCQHVEIKKIRCPKRANSSGFCDRHEDNN